MTRIQITHVGSLPRPHDLLDLMKARLAGQSYDRERYASRVKSAVAECVRQQVECGIDIVSDGEQSKPGFFTYIRERLAGFEPRPGKKVAFFDAERQAFPEYYQEYFARAMTGGSIAPVVPMVCTGPVSYKGEQALRRDLDNLKAAVSAAGAKAAFMPSVAPSGAGTNEYYKTDEEFFFAVADALRHEYKAIVDAGFYLQIDDPFMTDNFSDPALDDRQRRRFAELHVESINHALRGIPADKVRFHTCYGINEGPRVHDPALGEVAPFMLKVNAGAYSFEAANARHEHEYHYWEKAKLPDDKLLVPGVITHASNIVEHPELIAERLARFARIVGPERVLASADCGFSSQATYKPEVHPTVIWAKFKAMAEGARLANKMIGSKA
ncbi:MAG: cobalamin-independent methionine synthase II family protein [Betaproteobacteria bacterium]|nr:MAG: cobalamin-independent methionine synthase II family protein [Betaproteobacteria bacterium]